MNRRGFLTGIIAACAAPAIIRTPRLIMPVKPVVLPLTLDGFASRFLTPEEITRQALTILHQQTRFIGRVYVHNNTTEAVTIRIRRPHVFTVTPGAIAYV